MISVFVQPPATICGNHIDRTIGTSITEIISIGYSMGGRVLDVYVKADPRTAMSVAKKNANPRIQSNPEERR